MSDVQSAISSKLAEINDQLGQSGFPYRIRYYRFDQVETLKKNARFMRNDTFKQLVDNIKRDKALGSVPLLYAGPDVDKPVVLSGNHRVMAGRSAGLEGALFYEITEQKSEQERTAIALSHNSISGQDDMQILKEMYDSIADLDLKAYSGIDEELRKQLQNIKFEPVSEPRLIFKEVCILFLPREITEIREIIDAVDRRLQSDDTYVAQKRDYLEFFEIVASAKDGLKIRNNGAALMEVLRRGLKQINDERERQRESNNGQAEGVGAAG